MVFICPDCGFDEAYDLGIAAIYFGYCNNWKCPNCGVEVIFPKSECLNFTLELWRN